MIMQNPASENSRTQQMYLPLCYFFVLETDVFHEHRLNVVWCMHVYLVVLSYVEHKHICTELKILNQS